MTGMATPVPCAKVTRPVAGIGAHLGPAVSASAALLVANGWPGPSWSKRDLAARRTSRLTSSAVALTPRRSNESRWDSAIGIRRPLVQATKRNSSSTKAGKDGSRVEKRPVAILAVGDPAGLLRQGSGGIGLDEKARALRAFEGGSVRLREARESCTRRSSRRNASVKAGCREARDGLCAWSPGSGGGYRG